MPSLKDVSRLVNGLSLIAKEVVKQQKQLSQRQGLEYGDLQSLAKKVLLCATDVTGLTKGTVREFSVPIRNNSNTFDDSNVDNRESVVYFTRKEEEAGEFKEEEKLQQPDQAAATTSVQPSSSAGERFHGVEVDVREVCSPEPQEDNLSAPCGNAYREAEAAAAAITAPPSPPPAVKKQRKPRERKVPSTPFSRAIGFAGLGAGLAWGTIQESAKRLIFGVPNSQGHQSVHSLFLSEKNAERLALALCRMRGAALKLGQMLSIQDESVVPAPILAALDIVRQGADVMPRSQLNQVLDLELGPEWSSKLYSFDYEPMAAASIGQVHKAVTKDGLAVAMKIQYPGVADSIESDIDNVKLLLKYTNLIPEKLYLDNAMKVAKEELSRECDYELEAMNQKRFCNLLSNTEGFYVPMVVDDLSSRRVLTTELVPGIPIDKVALLDQATRNYVGKKLLELTLLELFVFRFMQVLACANSDREAIIDMSRRLGFITGMESEIMLEAHVQAGFVVGLPFSKAGGYDFRSTNITQSISNLGATMLRHRLTPPPDEAYSLHRKLSGAFLACIKLGAIVPCRELLLKVFEDYQFGEDSEAILYNSATS